jgi:hypothetical protein
MLACAVQVRCYCFGGDIKGNSFNATVKSLQDFLRANSIGETLLNTLDIAAVDCSQTSAAVTEQPVLVEGFTSTPANEFAVT